VLSNSCQDQSFTCYEIYFSDRERLRCMYRLCDVGTSEVVTLWQNTNVHIIIVTHLG